MALIGMTEAAEQSGYGSADAIRRALVKAGVPLEKIGRSYGVQSKALDKFIASHGTNPGAGRPRKPKSA